MSVMPSDGDDPRRELIELLADPTAMLDIKPGSLGTHYTLSPRGADVLRRAVAAAGQDEASRAAWAHFWQALWFAERALSEAA